MIYNEEADKFLEEFYNAVGATTWEHKYNLLILKLGSCNFSHNSSTEQKVRCLEHELLEAMQLIIPVYV